MSNRELTGKERYELRKKEKEKEYLGKIRKKKIKKITMVLLPLALIIGSIVLALTNYSPRETQGRAKIEINPLEYDAGTVSMAAGLVKKTYEIKNTGDGDLKIDRIWTSCHCTTARLKVGEKVSSEFGMDGSSPFWSQKIAPGQTGYLEVTFDPAYHGPAGLGPVIRAIYLSTNDPQNKKVEVRLSANVIS